jgi:hypothetical protein
MLLQRQLLQALTPVLSPILPKLLGGNSLSSASIATSITPGTNSTSKPHDIVAERVGIGLGVVVSVLLILAIILLTCVFRRRRPQLRRGTDMHENATLAELQAGNDSGSGLSPRGGLLSSTWGELLRFFRRSSNYSHKVSEKLSGNITPGTQEVEAIPAPTLLDSTPVAKLSAIEQNRNTT